MNVEYEHQEVIAEKISLARKALASRSAPAFESIKFRNFWTASEELVIVVIHKGYDYHSRNPLVRKVGEQAFADTNSEIAGVIAFEPSIEDFSKLGTLMLAGKPT